jgi:hypothetical protein
MLDTRVRHQDYRKRFSKLRNARSDFVFGTPSHAEIERRAVESITKMKTEGTRQHPSAATADISSTLSPTPPYTDNDDLLRKTCSRAVATFLSPNATKELPVDAIVRDTVIRNLAHDCHPDVVSLAKHMFVPTLKSCPVFACLRRSLQSFRKT